MTNQANTTSTAGDGVPAFLDATKRPASTAPAKSAATPKVEAASTPDKAVAKTTARQAAKVAKDAAKVAAKAAKLAAKPAPKAKTEKVEAKGSGIERTEANPSRSIVPAAFKAKYAEHGGTNGDRVAAALKAALDVVNQDGRHVVDYSLLKTIADENGIDFAKYATLNPGQQRMNVGNRLRGIVKSGKTVTIGKTRVASLGQVAA